MGQVNWILNLYSPTSIRMFNTRNKSGASTSTFMGMAAAASFLFFLSSIHASSL
jgi:hypothetical protein